MENKTIAICGFSTTTLPALKNSKADEIWTLNHAFVMQWAFPRFDRVFEIHKQDWFVRQGEYKLERYDHWLRQAHPFPIYMQEVFPEYPSSVRFPREEIDQLVFGRLLRGDEPNLYYTSSFSFMVGFAILNKVKRIEIYGVDMTNDTEYNFQKPGGEFMIGVAIGRGIDVVLQPNSALCKAQLYAYDRVPSASRERAMELADLYEAQYKEFKQISDEQAGLYNSGEQKDPSIYMNALAFCAMTVGGFNSLRAMLKGDDYFFGRQFLENKRHDYYTQEESWLSQTNEKHAIYKAYAAEKHPSIVKAWQEYLDARWKMYANSGARQAMQKLIDECDMRVVPDELRLEIKDE